MYQGLKYQQTKNLNVVEIAKLCRADIKAAIAMGCAQAKGTIPFPGAAILPPGLVVGVRVDKYSMGCSIDITIKELPAGFKVWTEDYLTFIREKRYNTENYYQPRHTPEYAAVQETLAAILRAYNQDSSDSQTDYYNVRFSQSVCLDARYSAERMAACCS